MTGDSGEAAAQGVTLTWAYDATAKTLTVQCTKHPIYAPCVAVNARIKSLFANSGC